MATITGTVREIKPASGNFPFKVKLSDGNEYASFDDALPKNFQIGQQIEADVESKPTVKNGKTYTNHYINSWKELAPSPAGTEASTTAPPTDWDAKDRTIAMESAYASSARLFAGAWAAGDIDETLKKFALTARAIYRDVQKARAGESFEPKEQH